MYESFLWLFLQPPSDLTWAKRKVTIISSINLAKLVYFFSFNSYFNAIVIFLFSCAKVCTRRYYNFLFFYARCKKLYYYTYVQIIKIHSRAYFHLHSLNHSFFLYLLFYLINNNLTKFYSLYITNIFFLAYVVNCLSLDIFYYCKQTSSITMCDVVQILISFRANFFANNYCIIDGLYWIFYFYFL